MMDECASVETQKIDERNGGKIFPNVKETLDELVKDYRLFIVSNCQKGYIEAFLRINGLEEYFEDTENAENTGLQKGENNKLVIERNNLKNPVYVGDTKGDARSAEFVGIPFVYAEYGFDTVEILFMLVIQKVMREVLNLLEYHLYMPNMDLIQ